METLRIEVIKKVLMLDTITSLENVRDNVIEQISKELDKEDQDQAEFKKWKANQVNGQRFTSYNFRRNYLLRLLLF